MPPKRETSSRSSQSSERTVSSSWIRPMPRRRLESRSVQRRRGRTLATRRPAEWRQVLVIGNEGWPFPVPLTKDAGGWRFDTAAGKEEVLARRVGRNELAVIRICQTYAAAQRLYAERGHDGRRTGIYARTFRSDPGRQNGLYWPTGRGEKRSPLGDLVAHAAEEGRPFGKDGAQPSPFHGYYFRVLTAQGLPRRAAPGITSSTARCRAALHSSRGRRSTASPES